MMDPIIFYSDAIRLPQFEPALVAITRQAVAVHVIIILRGNRVVVYPAKRRVVQWSGQITRVVVADLVVFDMKIVWALGKRIFLDSFGRLETVLPILRHAGVLDRAVGGQEQAAARSVLDDRRVVNIEIGIAALIERVVVFGRIIVLNGQVFQSDVGCCVARVVVAIDGPIACVIPVKRSADAVSSSTDERVVCQPIHTSNVQPGFKKVHRMFLHLVIRIIMRLWRYYDPSCRIWEI